jgi:hypothetical protein
VILLLSVSSLHVVHLLAAAVAAAGGFFKVAMGVDGVGSADDTYGKG